MTKLRTSLLAASLAAVLAVPAHAAVFADGATTENVTFFDSGILTGAPDGGGAFLSNTFDPPTLLGSITYRFSAGLIDGPGTDIKIYDVVSSAPETFDVAVSLDGLVFTPIGGFSATNNLIDVAGAFAGRFDYVRVTNTSAINSPDLDTAEGFHPFVGVVPEPASVALLLAGLGGLLAARRRR